MTRTTLDNTLETQGYRLAAVVGSGVHGHRFGEALAFWGQKAPLAILIAGPGGVTALDLQGRPLDRARIEALAPGAWAAFETAADAAPQQKSR